MSKFNAEKIMFILFPYKWSFPHNKTVKVYFLIVFK